MNKKTTKNAIFKQDLYLNYNIKCNLHGLNFPEKRV